MPWLKLSRLISQRRNVAPQNKGAQIRVQLAELCQPNSSEEKFGQKCKNLDKNAKNLDKKCKANIDSA